jgi:hypothetical protein
MATQSWFTRPVFVSSTFGIMREDVAIPLPAKTNLDLYDQSDYLIKKNSRNI